MPKIRLASFKAFQFTVCVTAKSATNRLWGYLYLSAYASVVAIFDVSVYASTIPV